MKAAAISDEQINKTASPIIVDLRIPGRWLNQRDLIEHLPGGCRITSQSLLLPDGARIDLGFLPPDDQFPKIFRSACRMLPTQKELVTVDNYRINVTLSGKGGSIEAARAIMKAVAAIVQAGGAGVFIDNSVLAHGGRFWLEMTEDGGMDALSFAFVNIIKGNTDIWTMGMHVFGLPDMVLKRAEAERDFDIVEPIRSMISAGKPAGTILSGENGSSFRCHADDGGHKVVNSPMRNPFGRLRLVSLQHA